MLEPVPPILSSRGVTSIILISVCWLLTAILLVLRLYTNFHIRHLVTLSDWMIVACFFVSSAFNVSFILCCLYGGLGFHADTIDPAYVRNEFKLMLGTQTAYHVSLCLSKCSICCLITTIFPTRSIRVAARAISASCILWAIGGILVVFLASFVACQPGSFNWYPTGIQGKCINTVPAWITIGVLDVVLDTAILILPLPMLAKLKLRLSRRLAVSSVFILGVITLLGGIVRTVTVAHLTLPDFTYENYYASIWSAVEPCVAAAVACMMTLRPLEQLYWPRVRDFLHIPVLCGGDTPDDGETIAMARTTHPGYAFSTVSSRRNSQVLGLVMDHTETYLNMNGDDNYNATTPVPSTANTSMPVTPAQSQKLKGRQRATSHDTDVENEAPIFSMGATPALPPPDG